MASQENPAYRDAAAPVETRVEDLLGRMTLEEKVRQMSFTQMGRFFTTKGRFSIAKAKRFLKGRSIGGFQDPRHDPQTSAEAVNAVQRVLVEQTRLGIPAIVIGECLHGHMSVGATMHPQAIALGSTWNPALIERMAEAIAREARAVGCSQALSPDLDLAREPRWGRVEETYGEDPYLVERMAVAFIRGMQGTEPTVDGEHLVCTPKHYAAHGDPEGGVNLGPVAGGLRALYSLYLPPFRAAVMEAGALSIMPAYSEFDGVPAHASALLLTRVLREQWGFKGYTFSDYSGVFMLHKFHRTARSPEEAGKQALEAGLDLEAPGDYGYGDRLLGLVEKGEVDEALVDRAVARILRVKFLAGLFENPYADVKKAKTVVGCAAHRQLAREIAQEAIILVKNERDLLPLDPNLTSIAVIGPNADVVQYGDYSRPKPEDVSPLAGIRNAVSKETEVRHATGCHLYREDTSGFAGAVAAAAASDVAVVVIGGTSSMMGGVGWGSADLSATCGEGHDRHDISPPGVQEDLVRAVHATGTPTVVVTVHGRPYAMEWIAENVPAIVEAWYPGCEGGNALADILFGTVNPSGKLPVSVPRTTGHVPVFYNHKPSARGYYHKPGRPGEPGRDYVFSAPTPLYEFGHGLSYTRFSTSALKASPPRILPGGRVTVSVAVRNAGKRAGKEVVQLYVNDVVSSVTTPVKQLRRFEKVHLEPGEKRTLTFTLGPDDLQLLDRDMNWVVEPGEFEVTVGGKRTTFEVVDAL